MTTSPSPCSELPVRLVAQRSFFRVGEGAGQLAVIFHDASQHVIGMRVLGPDGVFKPNNSMLLSVQNGDVPVRELNEREFSREMDKRGGVRVVPLIRAA